MKRSHSRSPSLPSTNTTTNLQRLHNHVTPSISFVVLPDEHGGLGAFAPPFTGLKSGSTIGRINASFAMSVSRSVNNSPVGTRIKTIFDNKSKQPSNEFILFLDMAVGRIDPSHPNHPYLSTLPSTLVDVPSWPNRSSLNGTNLGAAASSSNAILQSELDEFLPDICCVKGEEEGIYKSEWIESGEGIRWGKSNFRSRRYVE